MSKKIFVSFDDDTKEKIELLKSELGITYTTQLIKFAIFSLYNKEVKVKKISLSPEDRAKKKIDNQEEMKKANLKLERERLIKIATAPYPEGLAGTVSGEVVEYYTYFEKGRDQSTIPLSEIDKDLISYQYQPSYEEVKRLQELGKVDYKL